MDSIKASRRTNSTSSTANAPAVIVPPRTTKTASKLVVFPPNSPPPLAQPEAHEEALYGTHFPEFPAQQLPTTSPMLNPADHKSKEILNAGPRTEAESLSKEFRVHLPRVTAYCASDAYDIKAAAAFLKTKHGVVGRVYDECLYVSYEHRLAGGDAALIERHTARVLKPTVPHPHQEVALNLDGNHAKPSSLVDDSVSPHQPSVPPPTPLEHSSMGTYANFPDTGLMDPHLMAPTATEEELDAIVPLEERDPSADSHSSNPEDLSSTTDTTGLRRRGRHGGSSVNLNALGIQSPLPPRASLSGNGAAAAPLVVDHKWMGRNEVFLFDFGVIVLWNFTVEEENLYLSILKPFATNARSPSDAEVEDFHFQYSFTRPNQPRIYNDMITLKSGNPMIKLTISHGIAQSAKLARFENIMEAEIEETSALPRMMAKYGEVRLTREDVMKIVGRLFRLRMDVNLVSNVLDTPEIFWSEPELQGLYNAIRGYLEISQRVKLLNTRTGVVSDLLDMLSDHLHGDQMSMITLIVIILIVICCVVATAEVYVKLLLEARGGH
ncbi:hypothetical protein HDU98_002891 [Podochytrium sp. JEL0797]|nr:hypothetical protein HDU98_002891 [Podochytrium sp. JEL0797]